ncbi:MAG: caspase family protein [Bacteroidales bacterium]|nr:caspase family protein [Bacteroidales bacterium]
MRRAVAILLAMLWSVAVSITQAQVKETIVNERFVNNQLGWPVESQPDYSSSINYGHYNIKYNRETGSKTFDIATKLHPGRNFFIETTGRIKSGTKNGGFGIVWGKGKYGFFSFVITDNGTFFVREARAGGKNEYLVKPTVCKDIHKGGRENKLRVQYQQKMYVFFINDSLAAHIPFEKFYGDNLGLVIYGHQDVDVTSFGVFGTKQYEVVNSDPVQLHISGYAINDAIDSDGTKLGNGNSRINRGETIKMQVSLKNTARTTAQSFSAYISSESTRVRVIESGKKIPLSTVSFNEVAKLEFKFHVDDDFTASDILFKLDIIDQAGKLSEEIPFKVPVNTGIPAIDHKDLSVTINFKERALDDVNNGIPTTLNQGDNTCAIIIGVEKYNNLPAAQFAANDAVVFYNYMTKVLRIPRQNIILFTDQNATKARIVNIFKPNGQLEHISTNRIDHVIFYFSGLGSVNPQSSAPYILLSDSRANDAEHTGYPVADIIRVIHNLRPKTAICFFETSFSGVTRSGEPFEDNGGTLWNLPSLPVLSSSEGEMAVFYASAGEQANPVVEQSRHGLFTHYMLSTIKQSAFSNSTLTMKALFTAISREMMKECGQRGITVVPKLDCINKDIITILK